MKKYLLSLLVLFAGLALPALAVAADAAVEEANSAQTELAEFAVQKLKQYTEKGEAALASVADVMMREAPLVVEEFLSWRAMKAAFYGSVFALPVLVWWGFFYWFFGKKLDDVEWWIGGGIVGAAATVLSLGISIAHWLDFIQIKVAPRVYLLENIRDLL